MWLSFLFIINLSMAQLIHNPEFNSYESLIGFRDIFDLETVSHSRPWQPPDYSNQELSLGYDKSAFEPQGSLKDRVRFWKEIYSRYSSSQGVIHDTENLNIIYEAVDFTDINSRDDLNQYQKRRLRIKRVKALKRQVQARLKKIAKYDNPKGLSGRDLKYWMLLKKHDIQNIAALSRYSRIRFQLGQRDYIIKGIFYSGRFLKQIEEIFKKHGLPLELTRMPFVESSFNYRARSKVGASGIWQIMPYTAKPYLKNNLVVDERNDPLKATEASALILKNNYEMLEAWPLAVTGYNHGPTGVRRVVNRKNSKELHELIDADGFGFASSNFYASFLAILEVEKNASKYFGKVYWDVPTPVKEIKLSKNIKIKNLLSWFDNNKQLAQIYNSHLERRVWKDRVRIGKGNFIRVPEKNYQQALKDLESLNSLALINGKTYKVRSGDTLERIARLFGVSLSKLKRANDNVNPRRLQIGQKIYIPTH